MEFLDRPAERPDELFDRERELERLRKPIASRALTLVVGVRRVARRRSSRLPPTASPGST